MSKQLIHGKMKLFRNLLIIILLLTGSILSAQPDSLLYYLETAAKNNPGIRQKFTEYQAALEKVPQVGSLSDPELSIGVFLSPMELLSGKQVSDIRLMQMFPWFGVLRNAKDEMSLMANAKFEVFRDAKLQVYYDVYRTWNELVKVRKDIDISEKNIEILKVIERLALIRFKAAPGGGSSSQKPPMQGSSQPNINAAGTPGMKGMTGNTSNTGNNSSNQNSSLQSSSMDVSSQSGLAEIYRIQIEAGDLQNNISSLKNQEQTVQAQFNSLLNRNLSSKVSTVDTLIADNSEFTLANIADSILAKNPMLGMLEFEKQSYAARKKMVSGMGKPMVGLGLNYTLINKSATPMVPDMNGRDMIMPMVTVTLPIYRKKYNAMQKEADLMGIAASQNYESTANALKTELYQAIQLYEDANRRVGLYAKQFQLASKSLDLSLKSFSTSSSGLTEVLRVRQQTLDYELLQVQAVADLNSSVAWLKRLMASSQIR
jgi:outer membrane protein TolC